MYRRCAEPSGHCVNTVIGRPGGFQFLWEGYEGRGRGGLEGELFVENLVCSGVCVRDIVEQVQCGQGEAGA